MLNIIQPHAGEFASAVQQSYRDALRLRERAKMDEYIRAREYYDGIHPTQLTDRMAAFLKWESTDFSVNYCPMVVDSLTNRLKVTGYDAEGNDEISTLLWRWWRKNELDRKQNIVHHGAVNDGDSFVLVEWDKDANIPRFHHEAAYAGDGVMVYYSEERRDEIEFASKSWRIEHGTDAGKMRRLNLYFANRIEKYVSHDSVAVGAYMPYEDVNDDTQVIVPGYLGTAAVNWWTDDGTETGNPLGVPIIHFKYNDTGEQFGNSRLSSVFPVQDALNKSMIDLLATMDVEAFGLLVGTGSTAWGGVKLGPGAIAAVSNTDADLKRLEGTSPTGLLSVYNAMVMEIARVSGTPLSYIQASGQVAAEGTIKQQEVALVTQIEKTQTDFGNSWEHCMMIAMRLNNAFNTDENSEIDTDVIIDTIWTDAESRNDREQTETLAIQVEKLGVSKEQAQIELNYDTQQRSSFIRSTLRESAIAVRSQSLANQVTPDSDSENLTQTENEAVDSG